jgi:hypothetical protein
MVRKSFTYEQKSGKIVGAGPATAGNSDEPLSSPTDGGSEMPKAQFISETPVSQSLCSDPVEPIGIPALDRGFNR